jgi:hypothetical protein
LTFAAKAGAMDYYLAPDKTQPGWAWLRGRSGIPGVVAQVRETGIEMTINQETAEEIRAWIRRMNWTDVTSPVRLIPCEST